MGTKLTTTIVAYNNYRDIRNVLDTLDRYTSISIDKKIFIVDNGTTISDKKEIAEFKCFLNQYKDVFYIDTGENLGFGKGHNQVLTLLDSEYHAIINPDILFVEDAFSKILAYMDEHQDIGMCIPRITDEDGELQLVYRKGLTVFDMFIRMFCRGLFPKRIKEHTMQYEDYSKSFQVPFGQGSFLVIRTDLFQNLHGFDEGFFMYLEDADLCKRVNQNSKLMYFPGTKVIHKWEQGSHKNKILFKYHMHSMKYYFDKWGWRLF